MRIYLDDIRDSPEGWLVARSYHEAIELLSTGKVVEISLDHDLGAALTGYDVAVWIEREVMNGNIPAPVIHIHTANPVGYRNIATARASIERYKGTHND